MLLNFIRLSGYLVRVRVRQNTVTNTTSPLLYEIIPTFLSLLLLLFTSCGVQVSQKHSR